MIIYKIGEKWIDLESCTGVELVSTNFPNGQVHEYTWVRYHLIGTYIDGDHWYSEYGYRQAQKELARYEENAKKYARWQECDVIER